MNSTQLFDDLFQQHEESSNFFLLLDTAKNHMYIKRWLRALSKAQRNQIGNLFQGTIDETSPLEVSPLLIIINKDCIEEVKRKLLIDENIGMFSIIETSLSKQALIHHLQPFLQAELPSGELALFRFYDPYILKLLPTLLDHESFIALLKPLKRWWYQELNGTFKNLMRN